MDCIITDMLNNISDNSLCFTKNLSEGIEMLIMAIGDKIRDEKL